MLTVFTSQIFKNSPKRLKHINSIIFERNNYFQIYKFLYLIFEGNQ